MKPITSRYLACIFIPPIVGATLFLAIDAFESYPDTPPIELIARWPFFFVFGFLFCLVPGSLFHFAMEAAARWSAAMANDRSLYLVVGTAFGVLCGLLIGALIPAPQIMALIGAAAGTAITTWNYRGLGRSLGQRPSES